MVVLLRFLYLLSCPFNTRKIAALILFRAAGQLNLVSIEEEILFHLIKTPQVQLDGRTTNRERHGRVELKGPARILLIPEKPYIPSRKANLKRSLLDVLSGTASWLVTWCAHNKLPLEV